MDAEQRRKEGRRGQLTLMRRPVRCLRLFWLVVAEALARLLAWVWRRKLTVMLPILVCAYIGAAPASLVPMSLHATARTDIQFVTWWLGLGILSSIGVGCGLQSGVLFLFPFIFK